MAIWPFRFKGFSKSPGSGAALSASEPPLSPLSAPPPPHSLPPPPSAAAAAAAAKPKRSSSKRKQADDAASARPPRSFTFTTQRSGSVRIGKKKQLEEDAPNADSPHVGWDLVPTLHHKRTNSDLTSRRSIARTQDEHDREAEIKALSRFRFVPIRSSTFSGTSDSGPKQMPRRIQTVGIEPSWSPASDLSLPRQNSMHSSLESESELASYKVSALDALAPRPTLRCVGSRTPVVRCSAPASTAPQKRPLGDREPIPEETLHAHKRVDDLADDLDASDLRELMERDARRRERQQKQEREKVERALMRKAEKQKKKEAEARSSGAPVPSHLERGVAGRELAGLVTDPPSAVVTSSRQRQRSSPEPASPCDGASFKDLHQGATSPSPLRSFHLPDEADAASEVMMNPSPTIETSPITSSVPADREKMSSICEDEAAMRNEPVVTTTTTTTTSRINHLSLITLIKWGFKGRRNSSGPSSFSNTSREEMQASGGQSRAHDDAHSAPPTLAGSYMSRTSSKTPRRTRSRFREDLPEHPLSPKLSSPDSPTVGAEVEAGAEAEAEAEAETGTSPDDSRTLEMVPEQTSRSSPMAIVAKRSTTPMTDSVLAMSFASVDSEGSWLASRIGSLRSLSRGAGSLKRSTRMQESKCAEDDFDSSYHNQADEADYENQGENEHGRDENEENDDDHDDSRHEREKERETEDDCECVEKHYKGIEEASLEGNNARYMGMSNQPQAVHIHRRDTIASREVLLDIDSGDEVEAKEVEEELEGMEEMEEDDADAESPVSAGSEEKASLREARRLDVSHPRSLSTRSAKLFELKFGRHPLNETRSH